MELKMDVVGKTDDGRVNLKGRPTQDKAFKSHDCTLTLHLSDDALASLPVGGIVNVDIEVVYDPSK